MKTKQFQGKVLTGVVFDATFENSIEIAEFVRQHNGGERITNFTIGHYRSESRLEETHMSFVVQPRKTDPNSKPREFRLNLGDFLITDGASFDVIKRSVLGAYWNEIEETDK